jgi:hypothetical protein
LRGDVHAPKLPALATAATRASRSAASLPLAGRSQLLRLDHPDDGQREFLGLLAARLADLLDRLAGFSAT